MTLSESTHALSHMLCLHLLACFGASAQLFSVESDGTLPLDSEQMRVDLRQYGFAVAREVFSTEEIEQFRVRLTPVFEDEAYFDRPDRIADSFDRTPNEDPKRIFNFQELSDLDDLNDIVLHPAYREQLEHAVGPRIAFTHASAIFSGNAHVGVHRDSCDTNALSHLCRPYALIRESHGVQPMGAVKVLLYLQSHRDSGGISFLPGSHLWSDKELKAERKIAKDLSQHAFAYQATNVGDLVLFDFRTVHLVGEHGVKATENRMSIQMTFMDQQSAELLPTVHSEISNSMYTVSRSVYDYQPRHAARAVFEKANISFEFSSAQLLARLDAADFRPHPLIFSRAGEQMLARLYPHEFEPQLIEAERDMHRHEECFDASVFAHETKGAPKVVVGGNNRGGTTAIARGLQYVTGLSMSIADYLPLYSTRCYNSSCDGRHIWRDEVLGSAELGTAWLASDIVHCPEWHQFHWHWAHCLLRSKPQHVLILRDPFENIRSSLDRLYLRWHEDERYARFLRHTQSVQKLPTDFVGNCYHFNHPVPRIGARRFGVVEGLAFKWNSLVEFIAANANRTDIKLIRYEDWETDKAGQLARLAHELGLEANASRYIDKNEREAGRGRNAPLCHYFTAGEIDLIWHIVHARAEWAGYTNKPMCS